jgi:hypothetical protein
VPFVLGIDFQKNFCYNAVAMRKQIDFITIVVFLVVLLILVLKRIPFYEGMLKSLLTGSYGG